MSEKINKIALVPAYKPDSTLIDVVRGLQCKNFEVVVVNDGSAKEYDEVFECIADSARIVVLDENQGKGAALKAGILFIHDEFKPPYIVVTVDADGQHKIKDACNLADVCQKNQDKYIIGKRNLKLDGTPLRSKVGNNITHFGFRQATLKHLNETQTGLRAFSNRIIDQVLNVNGTGYEYEMIVLMHLTKLGIPIVEVDIETVYENKNSSSHFRPLHDSLRIYYSIFKFALPSVFCFLVDYVLFCVSFVRCSGLSLWQVNVFSDIYFLYLLIISNAAARLVSTIIDIVINKRIHFKKAKSKPKVVILYILLIFAVFIVDTALIALLSFVRIIPFVGKIISALLITWISRIIQTKIFEE